MIDYKSQIEVFLKDRNPLDRYASFDFCFNYFRSFKNKNDIVKKENIVLSCLHLGSYLASWGMYRGSSFLLQKSMKIYEELLHELVSFDSKIWGIDVNDYANGDSVALILQCYDMIKNTLIKDKRHLVLATKIMMGVFGCIPAYDQYFSSTFRSLFDCGFNTVNKKSLTCLYEFYQANKSLIDGYAQKTKTLDFISGRDTNISYTRAKIIDMIGFTYGFNKPS